MLFQKKLFLILVTCASFSVPVQALPFSNFFNKISAGYSEVKWHFSSAYRRNEIAYAVKLAAQQARNRSLLFKLNRIQFRDVQLQQEAVEPINSAIQILSSSASDSKKTASVIDGLAHFATWDPNLPLLKETIEHNLKDFAQLFPDEAQECHTPHDFRASIAGKKFNLKREIKRLEGDSQYWGNPKELGDYLPSEDFIEELKAASKEAEIARQAQIKSRLVKSTL